MELPTHSCRAVLAFLALNARRGVSRHEISEALWSNALQADRLAALRTSLSRVRKSLGSEAWTEEGGFLRLNPSLIQTDLDEVERHRKARFASTTLGESLEHALSEWKIIQRELLPGWDDLWLEDIRNDTALDRDEASYNLACLYDESQCSDKALDLLLQLLERNPFHTEALEKGMKLSFQRFGRDRALDLFQSARKKWGKEISLPKSIVLLGRQMLDNSFVSIDYGSEFSDRNEAALLLHLFESNLKQGSLQAMELLVKEAYSERCLRHPWTTHRLLTRVVNMTEGLSEQRVLLICAAIQYCLYISDQEGLFDLTGFLIESFPAESKYHNGALTVLGSYYLSQRQLKKAREVMELAAEGCTSEERRAVANAQLATLDWAELNFELAIQRYEAALKVLRDSDREDRLRNQASIYLLLTYLHVARGEWQLVISAAEHARAIGQTSAAPVLSQVSAPLGLALVMQGNKEAGARYLRNALSETQRERMAPYHTLSMELSAIALSQEARPLAEAIVDAAQARRRRIRLDRTAAEKLMLAPFGLDQVNLAANPLRLQPSGALGHWVGEQLDSI